MNFSKNSGNLLIATGVLHNAIGFAVGWSVLTEIAESGFINSINTEMDRNAVFWFLFGGFMMIILGKLVQHYLDAGWPLPKWFGTSLLVLSLTGGIMMPASGFWLLVLQAILILITNRGRRGHLV